VTARNVPPITADQYEGFEGFPGLRDQLINGRIVLSPNRSRCISRSRPTSEGFWNNASSDLATL
jgi:hypothetical protein